MVINFLTEWINDRWLGLLHYSPTMIYSVLIMETPQFALESKICSRPHSSVAEQFHNWDQIHLKKCYWQIKFSFWARSQPAYFHIV